MAITCSRRSRFLNWKVQCLFVCFSNCVSTYLAQQRASINTPHSISVLLSAVNHYKTQLSLSELSVFLQFRMWVSCALPDVLKHNYWKWWVSSFQKKKKKVNKNNNNNKKAFRHINTNCLYRAALTKKPLCHQWNWIQTVVFTCFMLLIICQIFQSNIWKTKDIVSLWSNPDCIITRCINGKHSELCFLLDFL